MNKKTYHATYSTYNKIIGMHIEELKFVNKYNELHIPINNLYATNIISQIKCVECGIYHADCTYSNCNHFVNHNCAIKSVNSRNTCNECKNILIYNTVYLVQSEEIDTCSICLDDTNIMLSECKHHFHHECIREHYQHDTKCPMCRVNIMKVKKEMKTFQNVKYSIGNNREGLFDITFVTYN